MLIRERLERCDFSHSERVIIDFILKEDYDKMTGVTDAK